MLDVAAKVCVPMTLGSPLGSLSISPFFHAVNAFHGSPGGSSEISRTVVVGFGARSGCGLWGLVCECPHWTEMPTEDVSLSFHQLKCCCTCFDLFFEHCHFQPECFGWIVFIKFFEGVQLDVNGKWSCGRRQMLKMALPVGQHDAETRH